MNCQIYPNDWPAVALSVKEAAAWRCQVCNVQCRRPGEFYLGWRYELACAHITQDYGAPVVQVAAMCGLCHFRHDAPLVWTARRRNDRHRQHEAGQLALFAARG